MMKILFTYILLFLFTIFSADAQKMLPLEEAVATALQNNFDIRLAKKDSMAAEIDYSYRNVFFYPTLNASASSLWNVNNQRQVLIDTSRTSNIKSNNLSTGLALNWVLFDGLRMFATREKAELILQAGSISLKDKIITTVANVIKTYYSIARQKQLIKATDVQIKLNEERAKLAQYKLNIGTGAKPDVLQSKVDLNAQKSLRMQQETNVDVLKEQLLQAMNVKDRPEFDIPDTIPVNYNVVLGDILDDLENVNPGLKLARKNIEVANLTLKETKAGLFPTLSFNSNYLFGRNQNSVAINRFAPLFNRTLGFNYGFTANIPIFNQLRVRRQMKQDALNIDFQKLQYENQRSLLNMQILNSFKSYEQQKKQLKLEEENILLAEENVKIVYETYRLGMATLLQLREAQNSLAQAYDRLIASRYNTKVSETELMRLRGEIVK
jgi:outer membrane protein